MGIAYTLLDFDVYTGRVVTVNVIMEWHMKLVYGTIFSKDTTSTLIIFISAESFWMICITLRFILLEQLE